MCSNGLLLAVVLVKVYLFSLFKKNHLYGDSGLKFIEIYKQSEKFPREDSLKVTRNIMSCLSPIAFCTIVIIITFIFTRKSI